MFTIGEMEVRETDEGQQEYEGEQLFKNQIHNKTSTKKNKFGKNTYKEQFLKAVKKQEDTLYTGKQ